MLTIVSAANAQDFDMKSGISLLANRSGLAGDALQFIVAVVPPLPAAREAGAAAITV